MSVSRKASRKWIRYFQQIFKFCTTKNLFTQHIPRRN